MTATLNLTELPEEALWALFDALEPGETKTQVLVELSQRPSCIQADGLTATEIKQVVQTDCLVE